MKLAQFALFAVLLALVGAAATSAAPIGKRPVDATVRPILVPSPPMSVRAACPGSTMIVQMDFWPENGETRYIARFIANGGLDGGTVALDLPYGYEGAVTVPPDGQDYPFSIEVDTPAPGGEGPIPVILYASTYDCGRNDLQPLTVRAVNLFAGN